MNYRYLAANTEGAIQLIAASYLRHGFYWYLTDRIPNGKDLLAIDHKRIAAECRSAMPLLYLIPPQNAARTRK